MLTPLADRILVERIDAVKSSSGLLYIPECAPKDAMCKGKVISVGPKVKAKLKRGDLVAFSGRWDDLPEIHSLPKNYQMIREGDVGGVYA